MALKLKLHLLRQSSAWAPRRGGHAPKNACVPTWTDTKHRGESPHTKLSPSPKPDTGPLAIRTILFTLGLSLAESSFEKAASLRRSGTRSFVALFTGVLSSFCSTKKTGIYVKFGH